MFERVLIAVDGSDHAGKALGIGADIAAKYGSEVYLVHTPQMETTAVAAGLGVVAITDDPQTVIEAGKKVLADAEAATANAGAPAKEAFLGDGDPADDILKYADMMDVDLIVMGRRGLGGIASLLLGSISQRVSHGAKCTCLTVHR